jgi:sortase B
MKKNNTHKKRGTSFLKSFIPVRGDSLREWIRKLVFLAALIVFIGCAGYLIDDLLLQPYRTQKVTETAQKWYYTEQDQPSSVPEDTEDTTVYPEGIDPSFLSLYRRNHDIKAWLTFATTGNDLFNGAIDNPVVQTVDNDFYLDKNYLKQPEKAGTLYFDYRNDLSIGATNRNLIIYGHNLNSGLMFSRFNLLAKGKLEYAQRLTTLTLNTWNGEVRTYKVFAVMIINADTRQEPMFNYLRTKFTDNSFLKFTEEIRRRSLFDFNDVDIRETDEIITLSTCSNKRETHLTDARTVVVARRVREGEEATVDTLKTTLNDDVLMPKMWYIATKNELPEEYR